MNQKGEVDWFWLVVMLPAVIYAVGAIAPKFTGKVDYEDAARACKNTCEPSKVQSFTITNNVPACICDVAKTSQ